MIIAPKNNRTNRQGTKQIKRCMLDKRTESNCLVETGVFNDNYSMNKKTPGPFVFVEF